MDNIEKKKQIARNTFLLYIRMGLTMIVSLYTSRVVMNTLGVVDYGINNVVGGIVTMATLVTGSLASASERFIAFELGKSNLIRIKKIFATSVFIHYAIAIIIILICETIGLWFLKHKLNIPANRTDAASWVLQFSIITFAVNIISVPYNALVIAHERMKSFAYISILEVTLKLIIVFLLVAIPFDKLKIYGLLLLLTAVIIRLVYSLYCRKSFEESRVKFGYDSTVLKEMTRFAGYNFIEIAANMINKQGANFMLNIFFGPTLNAARGLSMQINSILDGFVTSFTTALNPQITKSYASDNKTYMLELMEKGSKYSFFLFLALSVPVMTETEGILRIWLKIVPDYAVLFVRLIFIDSLIELMTRTFYIVISATGKIKKYQLTIGIFKLFNLPICFLLLKFSNFTPEVVYLVSILFTFVIMFLKLFLMKEIIDYSVIGYFKHVIVRCSLIGLFSILIPCYFFNNFPINSTWGVLSVCSISFIYGVGIIYLLGLQQNERLLIKSTILKSFNNGK